LQYSFLPGQSLWESPQYSRPHPACRGDNLAAASLSPGCASFLAANERAKAQWKLEQEFASFEALPAFQARAAGQGRP
jgi:adenosine deaminase/adenosine deaminase CECR1